MDVLMLSNGKVPGDQYLMEFASKAIIEQVMRTKAKHWVLIPYAVIRSSYDERVSMVQQTFDELGLDCRVTGLHQAEDPIAALEKADGILVSGGNTWVLNKTLHDLGLIGTVRSLVLKKGIPYIGWSAGTNIACPTIRTTNDMPIVTAAILPSLGLVPFQINPHYIDTRMAGHGGESRDERILEFLTVNPKEPVVGLPEGSWLHLHQGTLSFHSAHVGGALKYFTFGLGVRDYREGEDVQFLMSHAG